MSQKLSAIRFKWNKNVFKPDEDFIKIYDENSSDKGYILEIDVEYCKDVLNLHSNLPFLSEKVKTKKCDKLVCKINDKKIVSYKIFVCKVYLHANDPYEAK